MQRDYYSLADPDTPVDSENLTKAYRYGKNIVPFAKLHEDQMKYKATKCLRLLGFLERSAIPRHYFMTSVEAVTAAPGDEAAAVALSALTQALLETDRIAICRYVKMNNKE